MDILTTDGRGRATLDKRNQTYRVSHLDDGVLLLEPARLLTDAEVALLADPALVKQIDASMSRPAEGVRYHRRSHSQHA